MLKWFNRATKQERLDELLAPAFRMVELKQKELRALRGLIGQSCSNCAHKDYCKNREIYQANESWVLGCKNWKEYEFRASDEISRSIGDVNKILWKNE